MFLCFIFGALMVHTYCTNFVYYFMSLSIMVVSTDCFDKAIGRTYEKGNSSFRVNLWLLLFIKLVFQIFYFTSLGIYYSEYFFYYSVYNYSINHYYIIRNVLDLLILEISCSYSCLFCCTIIFFNKELPQIIFYCYLSFRVAIYIVNKYSNLHCLD